MLFIFLKKKQIPPFFRSKPCLWWHSAYFACCKKPFFQPLSYLKTLSLMSKCLFCLLLKSPLQPLSWLKSLSLVSKCLFCLLLKTLPSTSFFSQNLVSGVKVPILPAAKNPSFNLFLLSKPCLWCQSAYFACCYKHIFSLLFPSKTCLYCQSAYLPALQNTLKVMCMPLRANIA